MAIITISREMGSGGIPIAHEAAEKLGYTLVDGEAIQSVAAKYGLTPEQFEIADEKPPAFVETVDSQIEVNLNQIELIILEYALKGNIIIYGRGGQDLLDGIKSVLRVRIVAPFEERVERWAEREWLDPDLARITVRKCDQQRAGFIKYYFDRDWDDPMHYDLLINTSKLSEDMAVQLICDAIGDQNLTEAKDTSKEKLLDLIIHKKIEIQLLSSPNCGGLHLGHYKLHVEEGIVTLEGHVHSKQELDRILHLASEVDGVQDVESSLKVREYHTEPREH